MRIFLKYTIVAMAALATTVSAARAQDLVGIKTNALYGLATFTPNLGVEVGLGKRTSIELAGGYNPWNLDSKTVENKKQVHFYVQPEFRYWFCERFNGHYIGAHAGYAQFNISGKSFPTLFEKDFRYQGQAFGGGLTYGYTLVLNKSFSVDFNLGLGVAKVDYEKYDCVLCGEWVEDTGKLYFGPTKVGISLVWMIK